MSDPFVGTWKLNREKSAFDPNHRPADGTMHWERNADGAYLLKAGGLDAKGRPVTERPQTFVPDGRAYPVPDFFGLMAVTTMPESHVIQAEVRREDGVVVGQGRYVVSEDGKSLVATTAGFDTQMRRFETQTVWDRQ